MSEMPPDEMQQHLPGYDGYTGELGVMDATRMGWRLIMSDFWPIWVLGLVAYAIQAGCSMVGSLPYIGGCISLGVAIFVQPPLFAGLFYAVARVIDGSKAQAGEVFEGFRQRYWPSVVAVLLPVGISFGVSLLIGGAILGLAMAADGGGADEETVIIVALAVGLPLAFILGLVMLLFVFSLVAVWDHPESGWEAMKDSVRLVKAHYVSTLGLTLLFGLITAAAALLGAIACCVGVFFTLPFVTVWMTATLIYLYRSWTGQPMVQPLAEGPAGEAPMGQPPLPGESGSPFPPRDTSQPVPPDLVGGQDEGPVPPTDIEPPQ